MAHDREYEKTGPRPTLEKELGLNKHVYAAGRSGWDAFVWATGAGLAAAAAVMAGGSKVADGMDKLVKFIKKPFNGHMDSVKSHIESKNIGPALAIGIAISAVVGKVVAVVSGKIGWDQAKKGEQKLSALLEQGVNAQRENSALKAENTQLREALQQSYTQHSGFEGKIAAERAAQSGSAQQPQL